jgi:hypothetical protein
MSTIPISFIIFLTPRQVLVTYEYNSRNEVNGLYVRINMWFVYSICKW